MTYNPSDIFHELKVKYARANTKVEKLESVRSMLRQYDTFGKSSPNNDAIYYSCLHALVRNEALPVTLLHDIRQMVGATIPKASRNTLQNINLFLTSNDGPNQPDVLPIYSTHNQIRNAYFEALRNNNHDTHEALQHIRKQFMYPVDETELSTNDKARIQTSILVLVIQQKLGAVELAQQSKENTNTLLNLSDKMTYELDTFFSYSV